MVRRRDLAVVVDSGSCLPGALLRKWAITVVPHRLVLDGQTYRDGVDIQPADFYQTLRAGGCTPTTSGPTPGDFLEAFSYAAKERKDVVCLTPAAGFSATHQSALTACSMVQDNLDDTRIEVVDSGTAAGGAGLLALAAADWACQGLGVDDVSRRVRSLIPRIALVAFLDTLEYLQRGGRIGRVPAWAGGLLNIKPVAELRMGQTSLVAKPRGRARATERLLAFLRERVGGRPIRVNVMEADAPEDADGLLHRIQAEFDCQQAFTSQFTPVMGAHTGPGLLGIAFHTVEGDSG